MQKYGSHALSPLLVLAGMYMLGLVGCMEKYAKPATSWIFIAVRVYMGLRDIFNLI